MKKLLKKIALPFIWLLTFAVEVFYYVLFVVSRVSLSIVPSAKLKTFRRFKNDTNDLAGGLALLVYWSIMLPIISYSLWLFAIVNGGLLLVAIIILIVIWIKFSKIPSNEER